MRRTWVALPFVLALVSAQRAEAGPCPAVTLVLDRSGSMASSPGAGSTSKWDLAVQAVQTMLTSYKYLPWGYVSFGDDGNGCADFSGEPRIVPEPATYSQIISTVQGQRPTGSGTNTGDAVNEGVKLNKAALAGPVARPGAYIILITDGGPTCGSPDPVSFTTNRISAAYDMEMQKVFVVGFGALSGSVSTNMDAFANAGGAPCMGATCNGKAYYAADSAQSLNDALDAISKVISGEFGGLCDDSCYANGCMNAGEICVDGACKADPCAQVPCSAGDFCYTDGRSPGTCSKACDAPCASDEVCSLSGTCVKNPCGPSVTCDAGQVCKNGSCVNDTCSTQGCDPGKLCYQGDCVDDPCRYVKCPTGSECVTGSGACAALTDGTGGPGGGGRARGGGCGVAPDGPAAPLAFFALGFLVLGLSLRRRRRT
jgi:MYXO-CTERM domain-containing protein